MAEVINRVDPKTISLAVTVIGYTDSALPATRGEIVNVSIIARGLNTEDIFRSNFRLNRVVNRTPRWYSALAKNPNLALGLLVETIGPDGVRFREGRGTLWERFRPLDLPAGCGLYSIDGEKIFGHMDGNPEFQPHEIEEAVKRGSFAQFVTAAARDLLEQFIGKDET